MCFIAFLSFLLLSYFTIRYTENTTVFLIIFYHHYNNFTLRLLILSKCYGQRVFLPRLWGFLCEGNEKEGDSRTIMVIFEFPEFILIKEIIDHNNIMLKTKPNSLCSLFIIQTLFHYPIQLIIHYCHHKLQ